MVKAKQIRLKPKVIKYLKLKQIRENIKTLNGAVVSLIKENRTLKEKFESKEQEEEAEIHENY